MMAAIVAAKAGKKVCVLEKQNKAGKKIYATGNGKCNFTNKNMSSNYFYGDKSFIESVLEAFSVEDCLEFFHSIGIYPREKNGYYYPNSEQAASVVEALCEELLRLDVQIYYDVTIKGLDSTDGTVIITTSQDKYIAKRLIIATGLLASPKLGSDGSIFDAIKALGHRFAPILPALCGFYCNGMDFKRVSGVRALGTVSAYVDGVQVAEDTGEIQFTDYGLSGIPVFQISHYLSKGLYGKKEVCIVMNLLPEFDKLRLLKELHFRKDLYRKEPVSYLLKGLLNQKLADEIIYGLHLKKDMICEQLDSQQLEQLLCQLTAYKVQVTRYRDYEFAQICTGGIPVSDIHWDTLESKLAPQVHFAGELIDVDGICGGYNLHFAWATGYIAGKAVSK